MQREPAPTYSGHQPMADEWVRTVRESFALALHVEIWDLLHDMKRLMFRALAVVLFTGILPHAPAATPVVAQVHVISIHVQDHAAFDRVFLFLRDTLQLPSVYGELSKPGDKGQRLYSGFSVGNAYLEPCGPYASDAPFTPDRPGRFHGLTFSPGKSLAEVAKDLGDKSIPHSGILGSGDTPRFVYLTDPLLTGKFQAVSIWEIQNKNDRSNLNFLSSSLQEAKGGVLGVKRVQEVRVGYPDEANLAQWRSFLSACRHEGDVWFAGDGPALRLVPAKENQLESIVLQVSSLEKAKLALAQRQLVGKLALGSVELDTTKTLGLRIILKEN